MSEPSSGQSLERRLLQVVISGRVKKALFAISDEFKDFLKEANGSEELAEARMLTLDMMKDAFMEFYASAGAYITDPENQ